ncbi:MAG TPA: hypothetical protein PLI96_07910 [Halothiobacillus sp.]|nr:hypothetical protein [Halothiobacillus sp.]
MSVTTSGDKPRRRIVKKDESMSLDGDVGELRGLMQGVKKQQNDFSEWLLRFEEEHKKDILALRADIGRIESKLNEHSTRNKVLLGIASLLGTALLALSAFFSGAWSTFFGKH